MPDRLSQLVRERNRKPWDPFRHHLNRARGQAPSTGRNSDRMEQWRGGRKKNMGRRGKRKQQEEKAVIKQRWANEEERRAELRKRSRLANKAKARIRRIASFCEQGIVVSAHKEGTKAYSPHMFTTDGFVQNRRTDHILGPTGQVSETVIRVEKTLPWEMLHSRFLRMVLRSNWFPFEPKSVLDQIVVATDGP